ncbi:hypothetical protein RhiirA4_551129 [Rhizophagus irregularis]|uniref:Uncharacterized protein n=1 Tax=Rhizophagus irregularis TaxID=588596 RepID=A0A2I1HTC1_9GLOM|nr:hypothetical protein RhiirA4_551129 [Rhizophagus irregularis]
MTKSDKQIKVIMRFYHLLCGQEKNMKENQIQNNILKSKLNVIYGVLPEKIPTTNNHLESFNNLLKTHQLHKYQNNNHLYINRDEAAKRICEEKKIIHVGYNFTSLYLHVLSDKSTQFEPKYILFNFFQKFNVNYYHLLDHRSLPYVSLPSRDDAIKKVIDHQNKLILSYIKDQCIDEKDFNNNSLQNNTGI